MLEIFIGGWGNKKSVIRRNRSKPDVVEVETPNILSAGEFKGFWVRWDNGNITVGHEGEAASFLSYQNPNPFPINFIGLCTGWGASGSWVLDTPQGSASRWLPQGAQGGASRWLPQGAQGGNAVWVGASGSNIPSGAFVGGHDNGEGLVVGRAHHEGALIPGKVVPSHGVCYVAWGRR
uniref:Farnesoic acid O-methyltransferase-like protein-like n=1 Tax=Belgica antarctica TaxID=315563 RepID=Q19Q09_9DIPT|nr:farnesoic acid O-methyltransferase-like protein-like [Belgica antarctica]